MKLARNKLRTTARRRATRRKRRRLRIHSWEPGCRSRTDRRGCCQSAARGRRAARIRIRATRGMRSLVHQPLHRRLRRDGSSGESSASAHRLSARITSSTKTSSGGSRTSTPCWLRIAQQEAEGRESQGPCGVAADATRRVASRPQCDRTISSSSSRSSR